MPDAVPSQVREAEAAADRAPVGWINHRRTRPAGARWLLASWVVLILVGAITVMIGALAVGMRANDREIERHLGTATATVLTISPLWTGIEFVDGAGVTVRPPNGVLYPGLLTVGQQFMVDYSTSDPSVVRVAGRTAAVGNLSLAITLLASWVVGLAVVWWLRRKFRARSATADGPSPPR